MVRDVEKGRLDQIISIIKGIEKDYSDLEKSISDLNISTRYNMLKEISQDIIANNNIFRELQKTDKMMIVDLGGIEAISYENVIEEIVLKIQNFPSKKVLYLRDFINLFKEISDSDKEVLINTLKDEDTDKLEEKMLALLNVFK